MCTIVCKQHPIGQKNEFPYTHQLSKPPGDILQDPICTPHTQTNEMFLLDPSAQFLFMSTQNRFAKWPHTWVAAHIILLYKHISIGYRFRAPLLAFAIPRKLIYIGRALAYNTFLWLRAAKIKAMIAALASLILRGTYTHAANLMTVWCAIFIPSDSRNTRGHTCELLGNYWPTMNRTQRQHNVAGPPLNYITTIGKVPISRRWLLSAHLTMPRRWEYSNIHTPRVQQTESGPTTAGQSNHIVVNTSLSHTLDGACQCFSVLFISARSHLALMFIL